METRDGRQRKVSVALRAYAAMVTSADKGAVRDVSQMENSRCPGFSKKPDKEQTCPQHNN